MNLLQAIEQAGDNWFRPILFKNSGEAYQIICGNVFITTKNVRTLEMQNRVEFLTGEWEIVTPEQVIGERK